MLFTMSAVTVATAQSSAETYTGTIDDDNFSQRIELPEVAEGAAITVDVRATSGDLDAVVVLFFENDLFATANDDREAGNTDPYFVYENAIGGDYYLIITRYNGEEGTTTGDFTADVQVKVGDVPPLTTITDDLVVDPIAMGYPDTEPNAVAEWTILDYMGADNNLEGGLEYDFDEFERAGGSTGEVRIVALLDRAEGFSDANDDWTGTRLYEVSPDRTDDAATTYPPTIDSVPLADFGELDTSLDLTLLNFIVWGVTHYPAERYAIIINDHGGAWAGTVTDDATGAGNILTLPELEAVFERAREETGVEQFDLLINDSCLMSSVEFLNAIAPSFHYVFSSPEIMNNPGFDMTLLTDTLQDDAEIAIPDLGRLMADKYMRDMNLAFPVDGAYMGVAVTDLTQIDKLLASLNEFTDVVNSEPERYSRLIGRARANTYTYSSFAGLYDTIDVGNFMRRIVNATTDEPIRLAAQTVLDSLDDALLYSTAGDLLAQETSFYNIFFPDSGSNFNTRYLQQTTLPGWSQMLRAYFTELSPSATLADSTTAAPEVTITNIFPAVSSIYAPVSVSMEVVGNNIAYGDFTVDQLQPDGSSVRLTQTRILAATLDEDYNLELVNSWASGVDDTLYTWYGSLPSVTDGETTDFELVRTVNSITSLLGRYRFPDGNEWLDVSVIFDEQGVASSMVSRQAELSAFANVRPEAGGEFQSYRFVVSPDGDYELEPGTTYEWTEEGIRYQFRPAPTGDYNLGFIIQNYAGETGFNGATVEVDNDNIDEAYAGYLDLDWGFNLLYPSDWGRLTWYADLGFERTTNADGTEQIYVYPVLPTSIDLATIARQGLERYDIVADEESFRFITVDGRDVLEFTYQWQHDTLGPFNGRAFAIYNDEVDLGFIFAAETVEDIDTMPLYELLRDNVRFFSVTDLQAADEGSWAGESLDAAFYPIYIPWTPGITRDDGWRLYYEDGDPFNSSYIATAQRPSEGQSASEVLEAVMAEYVTDSAGYQLTAQDNYYGEINTWLAAAYQRMNENGEEVLGRFYVSIDGETAHIVRMEAPEETFSDLINIFFVTLDGYTFHEVEETE